jgi:hypothetical protein
MFKRMCCFLDISITPIAPLQQLFPTGRERDTVVQPDKEHSHEQPVQHAFPVATEKHFPSLPIEPPLLVDVQSSMEGVVVDTTHLEVERKNAILANPAVAAEWSQTWRTIAGLCVQLCPQAKLSEMHDIVQSLTQEAFAAYSAITDRVDAILRLHRL